MDASDRPAAETAPLPSAPAEAATNGDAGPAVFVEPPELADGADPAPRQNGQHQGHNNQNRQPGNRNQNRNNQNRNNQGNQEQPEQQPGRRRRREPPQPPAARPRAAPARVANSRAAARSSRTRASWSRSTGMLDLRDEGYGFLRCDGYLPSSKDVYVSISQARKFALRRGDYVEGACRPASNNEKYPALLRIDKVSTMDPDEARNRPRFEDLTPLFPDSG